MKAHQPPATTVQTPTEDAIERAQKWLGFGAEVFGGVGMIGLGIHDQFIMDHLLLSVIHIPPVGAELIGITMLGGGQKIVGLLRTIFGVPTIAAPHASGHESQ